jgi:hypothetical protein
MFGLCLMFACMLRLVMISMQVELADVPEVDAELEMESPLVSPHLQVETATAECDPHMPVLTEIYLCCACSCHEVEPHAQVECAMAEEAAGAMLNGTGGSHRPHTSGYWVAVPRQSHARRLNNHSQERAWSHCPPFSSDAILCIQDMLRTLV